MRQFISIATCFSLCISATAEPKSRRPASWAQPIELEGVPNLHKVSDHLYRSAQPTAEGMKNLKAMGIKTIVNTRSFHWDRDEISDTGLQYEHIYMKAWHPERKEAIRFLRVTSLKRDAGLNALKKAGKPVTPEARLRVGTFDSRLVAVAYARSKTFQRRVSRLFAALKKAEASGNEKRIKQLEAEGPALQELIEKQSYSTWPIDNILKTVEGKIPGIAKQSRVDVIVSKWDLVYQKSGAEFVDVTDQMVNLFAPSDETRKVLESLRKKDPLPLEKLEK